jgi:hypothetical protein
MSNPGPFTQEQLAQIINAVTNNRPAGPHPGAIYNEQPLTTNHFLDPPPVPPGYHDPSMGVRHPSSYPPVYPTIPHGMDYNMVTSKFFPNFILLSLIYVIYCTE